MGGVGSTTIVSHACAKNESVVKLFRVYYVVSVLCEDNGSFFDEKRDWARQLDFLN